MEQDQQDQQDEGASQVCDETNSVVVLDNPSNEPDLFSALVQEMEALRIASVNMWDKFQERNVTESIGKGPVQFVQVLSEKEDFINNLTEIVKSTLPVVVLRGKLDAHREFVTVLKQHLEQGNDTENLLIEEINTLAAKNNELDKRIKLFTDLLEQPEKPTESQISREQLKETRDDMYTVLEALYPEETATEFAGIMQELTHAYMENRNNEEAQFVELPPERLANKALLCLIQGRVIECHPRNPMLLRIARFEDD